MIIVIVGDIWVYIADDDIYQRMIIIIMAQ